MSCFNDLYTFKSSFFTLLITLFTLEYIHGNNKSKNSDNLRRPSW